MPPTDAERVYLRSLGEQVRRHRESHGWSQEELAEKASLHRTYVGSVERGERNISLLNIWALATALETYPSELLADGLRDA